MIIKDVTDQWSKITTTTPFSVQNIGGYDGEVIRALTTPAATDAGFLIMRGHGGDETDFAGTGDLYARTHGANPNYSIQFAVEE